MSFHSVSPGERPEWRRRITEKAGMRLERRYPKGDIELMFYAVSRDDRLAMEKARRGGGAPA